MPKALRVFARITPLSIALLIAVVFSGVHYVIESEAFENGPLSKKGLIRLLDLKSLDTKFQRRPATDLPPPRVIIAAIDEKGVRRFGLWPWSRAVIGEFISKASAGGAKVIGFDAVFSDVDKNSSYSTIKTFVDDMQTATLSPNSPQTQSIITGIHAASEEDQTTLEMLTQIEHRLHGRKGDPGLAKALAQAKHSSEKSRTRLAAAQTELETWKTSAGKFYDHIKQQTGGVSPDSVLADAIAKSPQTVLGYFNFYNEQEIIGVDKEQIASSTERIEKSAIHHVYEEVTKQVGGQELSIMQPAANAPIGGFQIRASVATQAPLPAFAKSAAAFGYFNVEPDPDGPMRLVRLLNRHEDTLYPAMSLIAAARYSDSDIRPLNSTTTPGITVAGIALGQETVIPTDWHGRLFINYYMAPEKYFPTYSVADFIDGTVPPEVYKDKVVLFGMTAQGLFDLRANPYSASTPGVYIHASVIQNILDNRFLERFDGQQLVEILAYLVLGLLMGLLMPRVSAVWGLVGTIGFAVGLSLVDSWFIFPRGIWILNVFPTLQACITYVGISLYGYLTEGREKRQIRQAFQFYLTKSVVDAMLKDTSKLRLGGERRTCTVLFSDVRGFTTISEKLTPEELVHLLNSYLTPMTNLVFKYDGTLDKYMGDAIMAIFGAPVDYPDHASRACYVALEMLEALHTLQDVWRAQNLPELDIGIGLNTGAMSVGNMGSDSRFDYTVMGDNVNLGSRLEGINKQYGTNIIISEYTYEVAKNDIFAREMDSVRVKGKKDPVRIYELLGRGSPDPRTADMITTFQSGIVSYKAQRWDESIAIFERVRRELKPDDYASQMYIERCEEMRAAPPGETWDGVYTMTTK